MSTGTHARIFAGREVQFCLAALLILALGSWPYGYYQFLRLAVCVGAAYCAWRAAQTGRTWWLLLLAAIALLFNPVKPVYLHRDEWAWIDGLAALAFLAYRPGETKRDEDADPTHAAVRQPESEGPDRPLFKTRLVDGASRVATFLICAAVVWFMVAGSISYAASECSYGTSRCLAAVAAVLGLVDVYDAKGRCIGAGCNF